MKKILAVLLVLPLLSYLGFKAYMHYKVSDFLDKTLAPLSSSVQLKYGWVSSSLSGSAGVTGVRLYVKDTGDEVLVDSIKLDAGSLEELMKLSSNKRNADFPRQLTIQVKGMVVDFSSEYYQFLESTMDEYASADAPGLACGEINLNGLSHLRELGYQNTKIDATMRYKVNENATVTIALNVKVDGIQDIISTVNYDIGEFLSNPIVTLRRRELPKIVSANVRLIDHSYTKKLLDYCQQKSGENRDTIAAQLADAMERSIWGPLGLDSQPIFATTERVQIERFIQNPKELKISIAPRDPIDFKYLKFYKPEDIPFILNMKLASL